MTYHIRKSIDIDFSHHVRGHRGQCINMHGHTWKFEVQLKAETLDPEGFVVDFKLLKNRVLKPCHALLDHSLAMGRDSFDEVAAELAAVGTTLVASRARVHGSERAAEVVDPEDAGFDLGGARLERPGGIKVAVFPFAPTAERLAKWLHDLAVAELEDGRVKVHLSRVFETQAPVEAVAEFTRS